MPLEVIENITRVEADNRERKASAEAKAKQIVADAQRDGLALLQQTRAAAADRGRELRSELFRIEQYVELVFLIPVRTDIKATLDRVINECNQYGDFLSNVFTITNVKELTAEEVSEIINKNGDD